MSSDGGLRGIFRKHLRRWHWQSIETGGTGLGVPDSNGCCDGVEVWIEGKLTNSWKVRFSPEQVGWAEARSRCGGRVFAAVRQTGRKRDDLWLLTSECPRMLIDGMRLDNLPPSQVLGHWEGGPSKWDWERVSDILLGKSV